MYLFQFYEARFSAVNHMEEMNNCQSFPEPQLLELICILRLYNILIYVGLSYMELVSPDLAVLYTILPSNHGTHIIDRFPTSFAVPQQSRRCFKSFLGRWL